MRHKVAGRKLGRTTSHREAMLRNLVCSLIEHERVMTTVPKAKEARSLAEKCITFAKKAVAAQAEVADQLPALQEAGAKLREKLAATTDEKAKLDIMRDIERNGGKISGLQAKTLHYRRLALRDLHNKPAVNKLFEDVAVRYAERQGGYTRILKAGFRKGDNASIALFELV